MPGYETVAVEVEDGLATVTMNRPEALNAFNDQMKAELGQTWRDVAADDSIRAVLLTGAGRAFSTGGDIKEMDPDRPPEVTRRRMSRLLEWTVMPIAQLRVPVIAAVNGHAHGLGLSVALACDFAYGAESAVVSMAFTRIGIGPDGAASYFLPRAVGVPRAKELIFTARRLKAAEALELGLLQRVLPDEELLPTCRELAAGLAKGPTVAYAASKRLVNESALHSLEETADLEAYSQAIAMASEDHREGIAAFAEKRDPEFRGS